MHKLVSIGQFNLVNYILVCLRSWRVFAISIVACVALALAFSVAFPPKSEVVAQLMIKDDTGASSLMMAGQIARSFSLGDMFGGTSSTDNETHVIASHSVFLATARQLGLNTSYLYRRMPMLWELMPIDSPIELKAPEGIADTLSVALVFKLSHDGADRYGVSVKVKGRTIARTDVQPLPIDVSTPYGDFSIVKTDHFDPQTAETYKINFCSYDAAASDYEKRVSVFVPDRKADFINLSIITNEPAFGKEVLDHIIYNYIDVANRYKLDRSRQSLQLVDDRLASLASELVGSEQAIEAFKKDNSLTDLEADAQYLLTKTGTIEASLLEAQTRYEVIKLTRDFIANPANNYELIPELFVSAGVGTADNSSMISQYNQLILERMHLLNSAKSGSASVKQIDQQIDAMRQNIITSVNRLYENARVSLNDLRSENTKNRARMGQIPAIERQYITLKRDNMLQEQIYLFLLQQREEINMSLASRSLPAQVIDQPYVLPKPAGIKRMVALALGLFLGVLFAALYVLLLKVRRSPVYTASDMEALLRAPKFQPIYQDDASADQRSGSCLSLGAGQVNAEPLRMLRSQVQGALAQCEGRAVTVSSLSHGEGKTYIAANLAASLALTGERVVAVDAALRDPHLAVALDIKASGTPIADYVLGRTDRVAPVAVSVGEGMTLDVLPSQPVGINPADLLASERFATLMADLRQRYDYVVVDCAPVDGYSDIYSLTALTDMTVLVCRARMTTPDDAEMINSLYDDARLKRLAVVINGFARS